MAPIGYFASQTASVLRQDMTRAERTMWFALRSRRLGGFKFRRQVTIEDFMVDFLCAEAWLVVEIDGGQHSAETDAHRTAVIQSCGFEIMRFWNNEVLGNLDGVLSALLLRLRGVPSPNPLPEGEGL